MVTRQLLARRPEGRGFPQFVLAIATAGCLSWLTGCDSTRPKGGDATVTVTPPTHEARLAVARDQIARIRTGVRRAEVEKVFRIKDGGIQTPSVTRYYEEPEVMIEVPYDTVGGVGSPDNRVAGSIRIYRSLQHSD